MKTTVLFGLLFVVSAHAGRGNNGNGRGKGHGPPGKGKGRCHQEHGRFYVNEICQANTSVIITCDDDKTIRILSATYDDTPCASSDLPTCGLNGTTLTDAFREECDGQTVCSVNVNVTESTCDAAISENLDVIYHCKRNFVFIRNGETETIACATDGRQIAEATCGRKSSCKADVISCNGQTSCDITVTEGNAMVQWKCVIP